MQHLAVILAPSYSDSAPGHYRQYPDYIATALSQAGYETKIVGPQTALARVGYGLVHRAFPIVSSSLWLFLANRRLKTRNADHILVSTDVHLSIIPQYLLMQKVGLIDSLALYLIESPNKVRSYEKSKLLIRLLRQSNLRVWTYSTQQATDLQQLGIQAEVGPEICSVPEVIRVSHKKQHATRHGSQLVVARGEKLLRLLHDEGLRLCERCTYLLHPPAETLEEPLPGGFELAERNFKSMEYFSFLSKMSRHIYLYDSDQFQLTSGRVLDSLALGVPYSVPADSTLNNQLTKFGGGSSFLESIEGINAALNHPVDTPIRMRPLSRELFAKEILSKSNLAKKSDVNGLAILAQCLMQVSGWIVHSCFNWSSRLLRKLV